MDNSALEYKSFFKNYMNKFPEVLSKTDSKFNFIPTIYTLYNTFLADVLVKMKKECEQLVVTSDNN